jgi:hypothetical protein
VIQEDGMHAIVGAIIVEYGMFAIYQNTGNGVIQLRDIAVGDEIVNEIKNGGKK